MSRKYLDKKVLNTNAVGGKKNKVIIIWTIFGHFVLQPFDKNQKCLIEIF